MRAPTFAFGSRCAPAMLACGLAITLVACTSDNSASSPPSPDATVASDGQSTTVASSGTGSNSPVTSTKPQPVVDEPQVLSAADLAETLSNIEASVADPSVSDDDLRRAGAAQQRAYRTFGKLTLDEQAVVLGLVDADVRNIVERMATAGGSLRSLTDGAPANDPTATTPPPASLPAWNIVSPLPTDTLRSYYDATEAATGAPWSVLASINFVETRFGRIIGPSSAGALGPMQFLPSTWQAYSYGGDIYDPQAAISGAGRFLAANGAPTDMSNAVYRYNPTNRYVTSILTYANLLEENPRRLVLWHGWQVYVRGPQGTVMLPEGWINITG